MARSQRSVPAVHSERDALMRAILANPDDDLPKLVYADWQEEHGDPMHAELIRLLIEQRRISRGHAIQSDDGKWGYLPDYSARLEDIDKRLKFLRRYPRYRRLDLHRRGFDWLNVRVGKSRSARVIPEYERHWFPGSSIEFSWDIVSSIGFQFNRFADRSLLASIGREHWIWKMRDPVFTGSRLVPGSLASLIANTDMPGLHGFYFWGGSVDANDLVDFLLGTGIGSISDLKILGRTRFTAGERMRPSQDALVLALERLAASPLVKCLDNIFLESPEINGKAALLLLDESAFPAIRCFNFGRTRLSRDVRKRVRERSDAYGYAS